MEELCIFQTVFCGCSLTNLGVLKTLAYIKIMCRDLLKHKWLRPILRAFSLDMKCDPRTCTSISLACGFWWPKDPTLRTVALNSALEESCKFHISVFWLGTVLYLSALLNFPLIKNAHRISVTKCSYPAGVQWVEALSLLIRSGIQTLVCIYYTDLLNPVIFARKWRYISEHNVVFMELIMYWGKTIVTRQL